MLRASVIDPREDSRWPDFVATHPAATVFHQPGWTFAVRQTFRFTPRFHILEDENQAIVAAWPSMFVRSRLTGNRLVCFPFCHRAGPLLDSEEQGNRLLAGLIADADRLGAISVEVRDWPSGLTPPASMHPARLYSTHFLDLTGGPDEVMRRISHGPRNSLRHAAKHGVTVRVGDSREDLRVFYDLYARQRVRQHLLPQPEMFVRRIYEALIATGNGYFVFAEQNGDPVCVLLALTHADVVTSTHSASVPSARRLQAMSVVMWKLVEEACERGYTTYDMGRTEISAAGQQNYKNQWGRQTDLPYFFHGEASGVNSSEPGKMLQLLLDTYMRVTPRPIVVGMSRRLYHHLG